MGKMLKKHDWGNSRKKTKKGCVSFCHSAKSYFLEVVSTSRSRVTWEKETGLAVGRREKKREFEGKDYQEQKTS
jgi:hypothetical protein